MMYGSSCAQVYELPQSHCGDNPEGTIVFMISYIYYAHLASVRFEHSVCHGSLMTTNLCRCLKFEQVALLYKLDVIYSKSIFNDVSVPSAEKITTCTWTCTEKADLLSFNYWLEKLSKTFKSYGCKVFSVSIQKSSRFFNRSLAKFLSIFILSNCIVKVNLAC